MKVEQMDWGMYLENLHKDPKYKPTLDINTLEHCLAVIPSVKPIRNSTGKIDSGKMLQSLIDNKDLMITTPNSVMKAGNYLSMLTFLGEINRSKLVSSMSKTSRLGSLTPLPLYAYKLYKDITYNEWDRNAQYFAIYLGKFLRDIRTMKEIPDMPDINGLRTQMQTVRKTGELKSITSYRAALKEINGVKVPAPAVYMLLQTWIANVELRDTTSMILDPIDWDNVPEPLDAVVKPQPAAKAANVVEKEWWM